MAITCASKALILGSNPSRPAKLWNRSTTVSTPACHAEDGSSTLLGSAK